MPRLPRLFVHTSLVFLVLGVASGAAFLVYETATGAGVPAVFVVQHVHLIGVGWLVNVVLGVAYWMFPRPKNVPYSQGWAEASYWLLNAGVLLRTVFEPIKELYGVPSLGVLVYLSAVAQLAAVLIFVGNIWRRVTGLRAAAGASQP